MEQWKERVIKEKNELDKKLKGLLEFINDAPNFAQLGVTQQSMLTEQKDVMIKYSGILNSRIILF